MLKEYYQAHLELKEDDEFELQLQQKKKMKLN
jgi:hypothetical protein